MVRPAFFDWWKKKIFLGVCFLLTHYTVIAGDLSRYKSTVYNRHNGFVSDSTKTIFQSSSGHIWIGTHNYCVKLLPSGNVLYKIDGCYSIFEKDKDEIWVGTSEGIQVIKNNSINPLEGYPIKSNNFVFNITRDRRGRLWIASWNGLAVKDNAGFHFYTTENGLPHNDVRKVLEDSTGRIWVGTSGGLLNVDDDISFRQVQVGGENLVVRDMVEDNAGGLYIGAFEGLYQFNPDSGNIRKLYDGSLYDLQMGSDGTLYGASDFDILMYREKTLSFYTQKDGLTTKEPQAVFEDREGNIWIISSNTGVQKLTDFNVFEKPIMFDNEWTSPRCALDWKDQSMLIGAIEGLFVITSDGDIDKLADTGQINCLEMLHNGWVAIGSNDGLFIYKNGMLEQIHHTDDSFNRSVYCIEEDNDGRLWIGTKGYLYSIFGDTVTKYCPSDSEKPIFTSILNLGEGRLAVGSGEGLLYFQNYMFQRDERVNHRVNQLFCLDKNNVLILTYQGLFFLIDSKITKIYSESCFPFESFYEVFKDNRDTLWFGVEQGIVKVSQENMWKIHHDMSENIEITLFDRSKGFFGSVPGNSTTPKCLQSPSDEMVFITDQGLAFIPIEKEIVHVPPPEVSVEKVLVNNHLIQTGNTILVDYNQNRVEFEYAGLTYRSSDVRYKIRLRGFDELWSETTSDTISYNNLSPGNYSFEVLACNSDGMWSKSPAKISFTVLRPFYLTWWFYFFSIIVIYIVMNLTYRGIRYLVHSVSFMRGSKYIGPHKIIDKVGSGGMGTVYKARDIKSNNIIALKILNENITDEKMRQRFLHEGIICEGVTHPNVIRMFDKGEDNGRLYYTMEFVDGKTLRQLLNEKRLCLNCSVAIAFLLNEIIHSIHSCGVVHRDIKPDNIMIGEGFESSKNLPVEKMIQALKGKLKLLDFGLAKMMGNTALTQTGLLTGTVYYLPPETMEEKKEWYPEIDFYALGIMLYEMLTGMNPFEGEDMLKVIYKVMNHVPTAPTLVNPDVPEDVSFFTMKLIEKDVDKRLSTYNSIKKNLEKILNTHK